MQYEAMFAHIDASPHSRMLGPILKHVVDLHLNLILRSFMSFITLHEQVLRIPFATFTPAIYSSEISLNRRHLTDFPSYIASTSAS